MNQILGATAALVLALLLWGLGKRPQRRQNKPFDHEVKEAISLSHTGPDDRFLKSSKSSSKDSPSKDHIHWSKPISSRDQVILLRKLRKMMQAAPAERLKAIKISDQWGNKATLPIIRIGLKDADSRVTKAAAAAIQKYKRVQPLKTPHQSETARPPRNVSLMR